MPRRPAALKPAETPESEPEEPEVDPTEWTKRVRAILMSEGMARPVVAKLAIIMAELPTLEPQGYNKHFSYNFIKDTQVSGAIRPRMARLGLVVVPDVIEESWVETKTAKGGTSWVTKLKVYFTVIDSATGDFISGHGFGYGDDSGDKGANKAFTAAMKYWLIKLFQIGGEDDLESDERSDARAADRESGSTNSGVSEVKVDQANITGIARGGMSDKATGTQNRQISAIVKELGLSPEGFANLVKELTGKVIDIPDEGPPEPAVRAFLVGQTADEAGALIAKLVEARDRVKDGVAEDDGIPDDTGLGYG